MVEKKTTVKKSAAPKRTQAASKASTAAKKTVKKATATKAAAKKAVAKAEKKPSTAKRPAKKSISKAEQYAVIATGGKQYAVSVGDVLHVEKLPVDSGAEYTFDKVLLVGGTAGIKAGRPYLSGASVSAKVIEQDRAAKIIVFKKKRRKGYAKRQGHRQYFSSVEITAIQA